MIYVATHDQANIKDMGVRLKAAHGGLAHQVYSQHNLRCNIKQNNRTEHDKQLHQPTTESKRDSAR